MNVQQSQVTRPYTGEEYLDSIRDAREVWIHGERVRDVTVHPAFRNNARMIARLYDSLHDPEQADGIVDRTDTGSNGFTHPYFKAPYTKNDLRASARAIASWARLTYGWMGRTPDFKAAFLSTLGSNGAHYAPFQDNAARWYKRAQERCLFVGHGIVNPPIDRHRSMSELDDVLITVDEETDAGLVVSGAKVVGTGAAMAQHIFIGSYNKIPDGGKKFSAYFIVPIGAPGLKIISRPSYEYSASMVGSPFDQPLSSRLDENDGILVFDKVFVPWEDVFCYDVDKANDFFIGSGFFYRSMFHACVRFAVKMDFLCGLLSKGLEITGTSEFRGIQARIGEVIGYRNMAWAFVDAMVESAEPWSDGTVTPNGDTALAFRMFLSTTYPKVREIFLRDFGSALIYNNSHVSDWACAELRPYLDQYVRGAGGVRAVDRVKLMKLIWDSIGSEFGSRWELYEINFAGNHEQIRFELLHKQRATGQMDRYRAFVDECLAEYDVRGWLSSDLADGATTLGDAALDVGGRRDGVR